MPTAAWPNWLDFEPGGLGTARIHAPAPEKYTWSKKETSPHGKIFLGEGRQEIEVSLWCE